MEQIINSEKTIEVADLSKPFLRHSLDIQFFSSEELPTDDVGDVDNPVDDELIDDNPIEDDLGDKEQDLANPEDDKTSFKDDPQNQAFAQIRREKEAAVAQLKQMDAFISQQYGEYGIHTFEQYQEALKAEQEAQQRQQYVDAGLPDEVIDKLSRVDEVLQQAEEAQFKQQLADNYSELVKEYPELVKAPQDISPDVWQKWQDGKTGLSLTEAFELVNKKAIREHLQASSKQSTLNKINSKNHVRANGGEGAEDVDLTSVPAETMQAYRQMFAKELRTGKMKEADFVKHYKKSLKG
jgi:hypothetical protein